MGTPLRRRLKTYVGDEIADGGDRQVGRRGQVATEPVAEDAARAVGQVYGRCFGRRGGGVGCVGCISASS